MPKEVHEVKDFNKLALNVRQITVVWSEESAKVKARVGSVLYTCKMPFDAVEKFLSNFKGKVKEINEKPELKVKTRKSRKRKVKQAPEAQEASVSSQEVSK
jgi:hypothetical protein